MNENKNSKDFILINDNDDDDDKDGLNDREEEKVNSSLERAISDPHVPAPSAVPNFMSEGLLSDDYENPFQSLCSPKTMQTPVDHLSVSKIMASHLER